MANYHRFDLPRMTVYLTSGELVYLLQKDIELFKKGLERGKAFKRAEAKNKQYEKKISNFESQLLNDLIQ
jgi:hypothetical protein